MARAKIILLAWLLVNDSNAHSYQKRARKVLPLEHPLGRIIEDRSLRHLQVTYDSKDPAKGQAHDKGPASGGGGTSHAGNSAGGGFIGDGLSIIRGRANSHNGGSQGGSGPGHKTHLPSLSPVYYSPSYSDDGKGKGKGKGTEKSHPHSKSKSKSKGSREASYQPGGESIDGMSRVYIQEPCFHTDRTHPFCLLAIVALLN
jgi:hypothetical protein